MELASLSPAETLLQDNNTLISLPEVCLKLREVLAEELHTTKDISQVIMYDPALTTRLLKIVNSAYYGLIAPATDISHALTILGEKELNNLVIVTSIVKAMNSMESDIDIKKFWRESIFCAVTARNIATVCKKRLKEEAFISGLLLNVGKLLIYGHEPELLAAVTEEMLKSNRPDYLVEREFLDYDHGEVGAIMSRSWNFSDMLADTIANHHHKQEDDQASLAEHIIYLANYACENLGFDLEKDQLPEEIIFDRPDLLSFSNIKEDQLIEIMTTSYEEYFHAYNSFFGK